MSLAQFDPTYALDNWYRMKDDDEEAQNSVTKKTLVMWVTRRHGIGLFFPLKREEESSQSPQLLCFPLLVCTLLLGAIHIQFLCKISSSSWSVIFLSSCPNSPEGMKLLSLAVIISFSGPHLGHTGHFTCKFLLLGQNPKEIKLWITADDHTTLTLWCEDFFSVLHRCYCHVSIEDTLFSRLTLIAFTNKLKIIIIVN